MKATAQTVPSARHLADARRVACIERRLKQWHCDQSGQWPVTATKCCCHHRTTGQTDLPSHQSNTAGQCSWLPPCLPQQQRQPAALVTHCKGSGQQEVFHHVYLSGLKWWLFLPQLWLQYRLATPKVVAVASHVAHCMILLVAG